MKTRYSFLLLFSIITLLPAMAQQLQSGPAVNIINNLKREQPQPVAVSMQSSNAYGKNSSCGFDTINYTLNKASGFRIISLNSSTSGSVAAQWFPAPQALTISGFDFFATTNAALGGANGTQSVTCSIYQASPDSMPSGIPLATVTVSIDSAFGSGILSNFVRRAVFSSPVSITTPYVLTVENSTSTSVLIVTNDWAPASGTANGRSEWLSSIKIGNNFLRSYNVNVGGNTFNADMIFSPYVSYTLDAGFTSSPLCNNGIDTMKFTNISSPIMFSRFYSLYAYYNIEQYLFSWNYGDSSGTYSAKDGKLKYTHRVPHTVTLNTTMYGWASGFTCTDSYSQSIDASPTLSNATNNGPVCVGSTLQLSVDLIPGATYRWKGPNGFSSTLRNPTISNVSLFNEGTYEVFAIIGQCSSAVTSTVVKLIPTPSVQSNASNPPLCAGTTLNLSATTIVGATYDWSGPNGFTSSQQNPTKSNIQVSDTGTYSLMLTVSGCGTIGPYTTHVNVNPIPTTPIIESNSPLCVGNNLTLTVSNASSGTYAWTGPNNFSTTQQNPSRVNVTNSMAGSYSVVLTANGCSSSPASITVIINNIPSAPTAGSNGPLCAAQTLSLTATAIANAKYAWSGPNNFSDTLQNPTRENITTADAGTYSVIATVNGCPSTAATVTVAISSKTPTPVVTSNGPLCPGQTLQLNASNITDATYSWTGPNGFSSSDQNPTISNIDDNNAGQYSVTATTSSCGTSNSGSVNVSVNPSPSAPSISNNGPLCDGQELKLTASAVTGATYSWTGPNGFSSSDQNPTVTNMSSQKAGDYSVFVDVAGCGTSPNANTNVIVRRNPSPPTTSSNSPVCSGDTLTFSANNASVGLTATYSWTGPNSYSSSNKIVEIINPNTGYTGTYNVTVTDSGCTSQSANVSVTIKSLPNAPTPSSESSSLCEGDNIILNATTVSNATYKWNGPNNYNSTAQNPIIAGVTPDATGSYFVQSIVNGCSSIAASTSVLVKPRPTTPVAENNGPKCVGSSISLNASTISGAQYSWTGPDEFSSSLQNPIISNVTLVKSGAYSVVALANGCLSLAGTTNVVVGAQITTPSLSHNKGTQAICGEDSIQFFCQVNPFIPGAIYTWTGPAGFTSNLQNPFLKDLTTAQTGTYNAVVMKDGCTSPSGSIYITVGAKPNTSTISGVDSVKNHTNNVAFSVTGNTNSTFTWKLTGAGLASIASGQNTNTINVNFSAAANAKISVLEKTPEGCEGSEQTKDVKVYSTVGLQNIQEKMQSHVYPNPADKEFFVDIVLKQKQNVKILVLNLVGQVVETFEATQVGGSFSHRFDAEHYKAGIYFIQVTAGDEVATKKINIQ